VRSAEAIGHRFGMVSENGIQNVTERLKTDRID
jgi:hypothetical protein